jgi:hypothetical protein
MIGLVVRTVPWIKDKAMLLIGHEANLDPGYRGVTRVTGV